MQGFFSKKETQSVSAVGGKIHSCASCGLYKHCRSPKMRPYGKFEKGIIILGEAPGKPEDVQNKPWQGADGKRLQQALKKLGIDLFRDCLSMNAINCRPRKDEPPTRQSIDHCRSVIVWPELMNKQPKVIIPLGTSALTSVIGHRWQQGSSIHKWRGYTIPDQDLKAWVCPTFHPSYLTKMNKAKDLQTIWMQDLEQAVQKVDEPFLRHKKPEIEFVSDLSFLQDYPAERLSAFDYETTGIKPHAKGHKIVAASIADSEDHVWAFLMPKTSKERLPFRKWLYDKKVPKMAHNMKFENNWSKEFLKVNVRGWEWDSMLAAHLLDNTKGTAGLKFQTYGHFGIIDYNSKVDPYLKGADESGNDKNRITDLLRTESGIKDLLTYCALDSVYEYRLAVKQMEQLNHNFLPF